MKINKGGKISKQRNADHRNTFKPFKFGLKMFVLKCTTLNQVPILEIMHGTITMPKNTLFQDKIIQEIIYYSDIKIQMQNGHLGP